MRSSGSGVARIVSAIFAVIALILIVHIVLVMADASVASAIVKDIAHIAADLAWGFKSLFSFSSAKLTVFVNYGLATVVYLLVGAILVRLFRAVE